MATNKKLNFIFIILFLTELLAFVTLIIVLGHLDWHSYNSDAAAINTCQLRESLGLDGGWKYTEPCSCIDSKDCFAFMNGDHLEMRTRVCPLPPISLEDLKVNQ